MDYIYGILILIAAYLVSLTLGGPELSSSTSNLVLSGEVCPGYITLTCSKNTTERIFVWYTNENELARFDEEDKTPFNITTRPDLFNATVGVTSIVEVNGYFSFDNFTLTARVRDFLPLQGQNLTCGTLLDRSEPFRVDNFSIFLGTSWNVSCNANYSTAGTLVLIEIVWNNLIMSCGKDDKVYSISVYPPQWMPDSSLQCSKNMCSAILNFSSTVTTNINVLIFVYDYQISSATIASTTGNDVIMDGCDIIIQCSIFRSNNCFLNYERQNSLNEVIIQPGFTHRLSSREILTVNIITSNGSVTMTQSVHTSGSCSQSLGLIIGVTVAAAFLIFLVVTGVILLVVCLKLKRRKSPIKIDEKSLELKNLPKRDKLRKEVKTNVTTEMHQEKSLELKQAKTSVTIENHQEKSLNVNNVPKSDKDLKESGTSAATDLRQENIKDTPAVMVVGRPRFGKSRALNEIFKMYGFKCESSTSPNSVTRGVISQVIQKGNEKIIVIDAPGLSAIDLNSGEVIPQMERAVTNLRFVLIYVFDVNKQTEVGDEQMIKKLHSVFGKKVWQYSIILLTFCDDYEHLGNENKYKNHLKVVANTLEKLLKDCEANFKCIKTIFEIDLANSQKRDGEITAIPVGYKHITKILAGLQPKQENWRDLALPEIMKKVPNEVQHKLSSFASSQTTTVIAGGVGAGAGAVGGVISAAVAGAALGAPLGPVGVAMGGVIGAVVGGSAGGAIAHNISN